MPLFQIPPWRPYREFPGPFGKLVRAGRWLTRADVSPLRDNETIHFEALAWVNEGLSPRYRWQRWINRLFPPGGTLRLTDQRLTWMPTRYRIYPSVGSTALPLFEFDLADIAAIERVRGSWLMRLSLAYMPAFRITTSDGRTYTLTAPFGNTLRKKIAEVAGVAL